MARRICGLFLLPSIGVALLATSAFAAREPVLKQIALPHAYYFREMYLPQLTSGPSSVAFSPDGQELVYSMAGSLWRQRIGEDRAVELTTGPGYDYQPDWSPDGRDIVFTRHHGNALELHRLELATGAVSRLTQTAAVNLEPRYSPDGDRLAYVSTANSGRFEMFVAPLTREGLGLARLIIPPRQSTIARYYYSAYDHAIHPSWTPDGKALVFVSNREAAYGTGDLCRVALDAAAEVVCFLREETSWRARPEVARDGRRVLYSSYQGRQWHQLWMTTLAGDAAFPLTFGEHDVTSARWSPDGRRIAYVSNERGHLTLWVQDVVGGKRTLIAPRVREHRRRMHTLTVSARAPNGAVLPARFSVMGSDDRAYAPDEAWVHADDGFDPHRQSEETRYFHCLVACEVRVPAGRARITSWRGQAWVPVETTVEINKAERAAVTLQPLALPAWAPRALTADMHVHMNYGGAYRHTHESLARQARAEDLDLIYNTIVNKEQRIPDIGEFRRDPFVTHDVHIYPAQEHHTSFWGHLGLLHLDSRFLTPDFSAYQHSAFASPYPHDGVIADLAHEQGALVGYVHPYDWSIDPLKEKTLTHTLPVDAALGKVDYLEVVGFSDHRATAEVWHRLLNLGFRIPAGAGTDAMANYASLRGPVGMNRAYIYASDRTPEALREAVRAGRTMASNGPQLALELASASLGETIELSEPGRVRYRAALRSPAPLERFEIVHNGRIVAAHTLSKERTQADVEGEIEVSASGWVLARAFSEGAHPLIFDVYPYATTSPIYVTVNGAAPRSPEDARYFMQWIDRVIEAADARRDYNDSREKEETLAYLRTARAVFAKKSESSAASR